MQITAKDLATLLQGEIDGNPDAIVSKLSKIEEADMDSLSFIANPKYEQYAATSHAGILVVSKDLNVTNQNGTTFLRVEDPYSSFAVLLEKFAGTAAAKMGIESPSYVSEDAEIGEGVYIGAFAYIGKNVKIGDNVKIYPNTYLGDNCVVANNTILYSGVHLYHGCQIGSDTIIHSGVVLGSDGFGFAPKEDGSFEKVPQTGFVVVGDRVEIGANTVIDRATLGTTKIHNGVKLDNLVQIAHNVIIDENAVVASQAGISGSTKIGKNVMVGGQAGFVGHITIADGVKINAQSGVSKSVEEKGKALSGSPAESFRQHYKHQAMIRQLPDLLKRINELEKQLNNNK